MKPSRTWTPTGGDKKYDTMESRLLSVVLVRYKTALPFVADNHDM